MQSQTIFSELGLFQGPTETKAAFDSRCAFCLKPKPLTLAAYPKALDILERTYGIRPAWIEVRKASASLLPWQAACCVIEGDYAWIEMPEKLPTSFGLTEEEILAHEAIHVCRMAFDEPIFEEMLAYQTSPSHFRRFFGPLIRHPYEATLYVASLFAAVLASTFFDYSYALLAPAVLLVAGLIRLRRVHAQFQRHQPGLAWQKLTYTDSDYYQ